MRVVNAFMHALIIETSDACNRIDEIAWKNVQNDWKLFVNWFLLNGSFNHYDNERFDCHCLASSYRSIWYGFSVITVLRYPTDITKKKRAHNESVITHSIACQRKILKSELSISGRPFSHPGLESNKAFMNLNDAVDSLLIMIETKPKHSISMRMTFGGADHKRLSCWID